VDVNKQVTLHRAVRPQAQIPLNNLAIDEFAIRMITGV
jgi:hypothetical protein